MHYLTWGLLRKGQSMTGNDPWRKDYPGVRNDHSSLDPRNGNPLLIGRGFR